MRIIFKISLLLVLITLTCYSLSSQAQSFQRCSTKEYIDAQKALDPTLGESIAKAEMESQNWIASHPEDVDFLVTIPVVVHIVYKTAVQNVTDARVFSQIDVLNKDYSKTNSDTNLVPAVWKSLAANCNIQFCLATVDESGHATTGITRTVSTVSTFSTDDKVKATSTGGIEPWDRTRYLNIWVCNLGSSLLGYATPPGQAASKDGVVIHYPAFGKPGTSAEYNLGRTATHEVGHWLGLSHTWGDDGGNCSGSDGMGDTPNQADATFGCNTFPLTDACSTTSPGIMFMNYMDYSDDACLFMFTNNQKTKITSILNSSRASLKTSPQCGTVGIAAPASNVRGLSFDPNPSSGLITLNSTSPCKSIQVFNLVGQLVKEITPAGNELIKSIDLSDVENGFYLVTALTSEGIFSNKLILEH